MQWLIDICKDAMQEVCDAVKAWVIAQAYATEAWVSSQISSLYGFILDQLVELKDWVIAKGYATETFVEGKLCKSTIRVSRNTIQNIPNASWTEIYFNVTDWDVNNEWAPYLFTAKEAGYFQVNIAAMGVELVAGTLFMVGIWKNGVKQAGPRRGVLLTDYQGTTVSEIVHLNGTTDYIKGRVYQNSGGTRGLFGDVTATYMTIHQLSKDA